MRVNPTLMVSCVSEREVGMESMAKNEAGQLQQLLAREALRIIPFSNQF